MPVVNDDLVTAADLITYECPKCGGKFRDLTRYQCEECEKKFWNEITLDPHWFPNKLEDGSPDWNSALKDSGKALLSNEWSYGVLNAKTMEMERVPINRKGRKWSYDHPDILTAIIKRENSVEEIEDDINAIEEVKTEPTKQEQKEKEKQDKKAQKEVMKLIDKK